VRNCPKDLYWQLAPHRLRLQGLGGAVLLVGAYLTYRQLGTAREGQITERFTCLLDLRERRSRGYEPSNACGSGCLMTTAPRR